MNVLLVKPRPHRDSINLQSFMLCEPLELEYAAALLHKLGHQADILDLVLEDRLLPALEEKPYQVVAFTAYQIHVGVVKKYAAQVKAIDTNIVTLVGGVHAEVVPEDFESPFLDVVLTGGLYALEGVMAAVAQGIRGEVLRRLGRAPKACHFEFPHPDRSKTARYRRHYNYIYHDRCATIKTSFSCPYDCSFCFCTRLGPYFQRELGDVMDELAEIEEENVFIVDDDFLVDRGRLEDFCCQLDARGIRKTFLAFGRADFIAENPDLVGLLAAHGFDAIFVGLESFKAGELEEYGKRTTVEMNRRAVAVLEKWGVQCYSGLIVGMDWKKGDFDQLISYLNSFAHPMVNIQPITPIKGTPYYQAVREQITQPEEDYHYFDMAHLVMKPLHLSRRAFYYHILRAYWKTSASAKGRRYIEERYGPAVYRRVRRGALFITWQYLKLIFRPN